MGLKIFDIAREHREIAEQLEQGELTPELEKALAINENQVYSKGEGYSMIIKEWEDTAEIIQQEIDRLEKMQKSIINKSEYLKKAILCAMQMCEIKEIKTPVLKVSVRESEAVEIINEAQIPEKFKTEKTTTFVDKRAIKDAIKNRETVEGAIIKKNYNLSIK